MRPVSSAEVSVNEPTPSVSTPGTRSGLLTVDVTEVFTSRSFSAVTLSFQLALEESGRSSSIVMFSPGLASSSPSCAGPRFHGFLTPPAPKTG